MHIIDQEEVMSDERARQEALDKAMSPAAWSEHFTKTPCVRSSYLFGLGSSALILAHKLRLYPGNMKRAIGPAILTFGFTSAFAFVLCANEMNKRQGLIKQAMQDSRVKPVSEMTDKSSA